MKKLIAMFFVFLMVVTVVPIVVAENETVEPVLISVEETTQEYGGMSRAIDRIRLAFTLRSEKRLDMMNQIQEKRENHYRFLVDKGKEEQATRFREGTAALTQNFEQKRERIQQRLDDKEASMEQIQQREQIQDPTTHAGDVPQAQQGRT